MPPELLASRRAQAESIFRRIGVHEPFDRAVRAGSWEFSRRVALYFGKVVFSLPQKGHRP